MRTLFSILFFLSICAFAKAQTKTYFVYFKDKGGITYQPSECLSQRAIDRYNQNNVIFSYQDYKVYPAYVDSLKHFSDVSYALKWHNGVIAIIKDDSLSRIESLSFVDRVVLIGYTHNGYRRKEKIEDRQRITASSVEEIRKRKELLGIDKLEKAQYNGEGVWLAVIDAGFEGVNTLSQFNLLYTDNKIVETFDVLTGQENVYQYHDHGTSCLGGIVGIEDTLKLGAAPNVNIGLYVTESIKKEQPIEMYWWTIAIERIDSIGYDVVSNSLGYIDFDLPFASPPYADFDGETLFISKSATIAGSKGLLIVASVGNSGNKSWKKLGAPADAYNVISVGAVDADGNIGAFSSHGPSADGRQKPEVCGVGAVTYILNKSGDLVASNGTSYSAPQIAGLMAVLKQKYPLYTREELTQMLYENSSRYSTPNNQYGYGIPNIAAQVLSIQEEKDLEYSFLDYSYEVFSIEGKKINKQYSELNSGVYIIRYAVGDQFFVEKVVKL